MAKHNDVLKLEHAENKSEMTESKGKKLFIEPEISVPVDVLEATTFFQAASSGSTN